MSCRHSQPRPEAAILLEICAGEIVSTTWSWEELEAIVGNCGVVLGPRAGQLRTCSREEFAQMRREVQARTSIGSAAAELAVVALLQREHGPLECDEAISAWVEGLEQERVSALVSADPLVAYVVAVSLFRHGCWAEAAAWAQLARGRTTPDLRPYADFIVGVGEPDAATSLVLCFAAADAVVSPETGHAAMLCYCRDLALRHDNLQLDRIWSRLAVGLTRDGEVVGDALVVGEDMCTVATALALSGDTDTARALVARALATSGTEALAPRLGYLSRLVERWLEAEQPKRELILNVLRPRPISA